MDERPLRDLRALEREDAGLALESGALEALLAVVEHICRRADAIDAFFAGYRECDAEARREVAAVEAELAAQRARQSEAERAVAAAEDDRERELAERALARAADHVAVAERTLSRTRSALSALEHEAETLPRELERLEAEARGVAANASGVREPGGGPRELADWASHARAELFVTRSQLDLRRDRVIREANELATAVLGEPTFGSTVAQALHRVEAR
ncbi:MAG TPA: hypothetical protein VFA97_08925 [Gaiellaceae bacterium]|nr:hypothetical protein [Gaiellaceae bacterium]